MTVDPNKETASAPCSSPESCAASVSSSPPPQTFQEDVGGFTNDTLRITNAKRSWEDRFIALLENFQKWRQANDDPQVEGNQDIELIKSWIRRFAAWRKSNVNKQGQITTMGACALSILIAIGYYRRQRTPLTGARRKINRRTDYRAAEEEPLSLMYKAAREGTIERALLGSSGVFYLINGQWKRSILPSGLTQRDILQTLSTCSNISALPESILSRLSTPTLAALPFVYLFFVYRMLKGTMGGDTINAVLHSRSKITFKDVAGIDDVVTDIAEVVTYLKNPSMYRHLGARPPRAILLYGPPGTGKTLLAQAVAGEANANCFLACSASDFVEMYVGRGAARVRSLFAQARNEAKRKTWWKQLPLWSVFTGQNNRDRNGNTEATQPRTASAILFIDELDALAKTRGSISSNDEREQTLNQLLVELDGFAREQQQEDVTLIVIAASNRADVLDPAVLRRFDRQIHVGYPDAQGRKEILKIHAQRVACDDIDWDRLASETRTGGLTGADLCNMVNDAALLAVRDRSPVVRQCHMEHAARRVNMKWKPEQGPRHGIR